MNRSDSHAGCLMLIRKDQFGAMSAAMQERYEKSLATHLRSRFPDKLAQTSEADLLKLARRAIQDAKKYRITVEYDVRRYGEYMVEYQPDFDTTSWAAPILKDVKTGTEKMNDLDAYTTFEMRKR